MAQAEFDGAGAPLTQSILARAGAIMNVTAAVVSLALIIGVGVWGYKLLVRDVSGVPVVRALEGPMRMSAEEPGGQIAEHEGLAVNAIAEEGMAEGPQDTVVLAPTDVELAEEDQPVEVVVVEPQPEIQPEPELAVEMTEVPEVSETAALTEVAVEVDEPSRDPIRLNSDADVAMLVEELTAGIEPLSALEPVTETVPTAEPATDIIPASVPGVVRSLRPINRPEALVISAVQQTVAPARTEAAQTETAQVASGTPLVQLAAMDTPEGAAAEWDRLNVRYSAMFAGKQRLIQETQSNGRTFYRLRALGFADGAEANRFCTALNAEGAGCIPAVAR